MTVMHSQLIDGKWVPVADEGHAAQILADAAAEGIDLCPRCFWVNRVGGVCQLCARDAMFNADPDYRAWSDAQGRLDFGEWAPDSTRPYTWDDKEADEALVDRLAAKFNRAEKAARTDPGGCAGCGMAERDHVQRWHGKDLPWSFMPPSIELRKARIVARRNVRSGRPAWAPLALGEVPA